MVDILIWSELSSRKNVDHSDLVIVDFQWYKKCFKTVTRKDSSTITSDGVYLSPG